MKPASYSRRTALGKPPTLALFRQNAFLAQPARHSRPRLLVEPVLDRVADQLVAAGEPELALNVLAVGLDGFDAEAEALGDRAGAEALADQVEDLQLAVAQPLQRRARAGGRVRHLPEQACADPVTDVDPALDHVAKGADDVAGRLPLHDVPLGAGPQGALR